MQAVEPAPHEFSANFIFSDHGLDPFFATDSQVKDSDGSRRSSFDRDGDQWNVTLYYQESGIVSPGDETPAGTPWLLESCREFRLQVRAADDAVGKRRFNAHMAPRWDGMKAESDSGNVSEISIPDGIEEGVNVRVSGANIGFKEYHDLLSDAFESVGISGHYFANPHDHSNVVDAARYVRLSKDRSGPVHSRAGPIAQMGHLLENDRDGYRSLTQNDQDDRGNRLPGYYHTATLGPRRVREAFPDHSFPREVKHYYAREAAQYSPSHPLAHPKLEVAYQRSRWDGKIGHDQLDQLENELDATILSVLAESGIQVHSGDGGGPFVGDEYWAPRDIEVPDSRLYELGLTQIEHDQESVVLKYLADGLSPVQWESLEVLITDGGDIAPNGIAEEVGRHPDSVRRALRGMEELVHREYDHVSLQSPFIAELIHKKIKTAREATRDVAAATAKVAHAADRELDQRTSAFISWAAAVGADVDDTDEARMLLRFGELDSSRRLRHHLRRGFQLWKDADMDPSRFRRAQVRFNGGYTQAWRWL